MLGKLLKQEFSATSRYFIPLYGLVLVLTPLFSIMFRFMKDYDVESQVISLLASIALFGIFGFVFLVIAIFIATLILIIIRFYKTTATSEAYLTFTLPVKTYQIVLSKTITAIAWEFIAAIVAVTSIVLMFCISGFATPSDILKGLREFFDYGLFSLDGEQVFTMSLMLITSITGVIASIMKVYCSIAIGQLFRSHRVLISRGMYFGIYFALQFISMILSIGGIMLLNNGSDNIFMNYTYIVAILQNTAVSIAGFWITTWIMKKHLNVM